MKWHKIYGEAIAESIFINPTLKALQQHVSKYSKSKHFWTKIIKGKDLRPTKHLVNRYLAKDLTCTNFYSLTEQIAT